MNERLKQLMSKVPAEIDAVLITSPVNRRYYTGLKSSAGTLFAMRNDAYFIIDSRYIEIAKRTIQDCEVLLQGKLSNQLNGLAALHGVKKIAIETSYLTVGEYLAFREWFTCSELVFDSTVDSLILEQRRYKSKEELVHLQAAQDIADRSFLELLNLIRPGMTERQVAAELERLFKIYGGERPSFDTIAVSGRNSSLPHGVPTDKPLEDGDFFTLDFGTCVEGYCSDTTRTVAIGHVTDEMRKVYQTVLEAQQLALEAVRPGVACNEIDRIARDYIAAAGYDGCFGHGLGHAVGIEIHESPRFAPTDATITSPGLVMSVEPGIYLEGRFGCRIEDVVYITEDGKQNLTKCPKELLIL